MNKPKITFGAIKLNVVAPKTEENAQPETSGNCYFFFISKKLLVINDYFNSQDLVYLVRENPEM